MKFHTVNGSPNCRKVHAVINYLNLDVEIIELDIFAGDLEKPEFMALNANGMVPVFEDGDFKLSESNAIAQYLAALAPENSLYPNDARIRADIHRWQCWEECHFNRACGSFLFENLLKPLFKMGDADLTVLKEAKRNFLRFAKVLDDQLNGRDFILGKEISLADFSVAAMLVYADAAGMPLESFNHIREWNTKLEAVDAWAQVPALPV